MFLKRNTDPSPKELRQFGYTLLAGFGLLGGLLYWKGKTHAAFDFWGTGISLGVVALIVPRASKILYKIWMGWAFIMSSMVTKIVLTILFFGLITPVAILFRCFGRDALRLKKGSMNSYWSDHPKIMDRSYYQRLF